MKREIKIKSAPHGGNSLANVKEHAPPLAGASVETGVEVHVTGDVADKAASGGCSVSTCCASPIHGELSNADEVIENTHKLCPAIIGLLVVSVFGFLRCGIIACLAMFVPLWAGESHASEQIDLAGDAPPINRPVILDGGDPPMSKRLHGVRSAVTTDMKIPQGSQLATVLPALVGSITPDVQTESEIKADKSGDQTWDDRLLKYLHCVQWGVVLVVGVICFIVGYVSSWAIDALRVRRGLPKSLHNVKGVARREEDGQSEANEGRCPPLPLPACSPS